MAAVHPHAVAVVSTSAFHDVIGVVCLRYFIVWVYYYLPEREHEHVRDDCERPELMEKEHGKHYLENVISRFEVSNVDPLAVDVVPVGIPAAHGDPLLSEVSTFIPLFDTCSKTFET